MIDDPTVHGGALLSSKASPRETTSWAGTDITANRNVFLSASPTLRSWNSVT
jgi:hypothetical protein